MTTGRETLVSEDDRVLVEAGMVLVKQGVKVIATDNTIGLISTVSDFIVASEENEEVTDDEVTERGVLVSEVKEVLANDGDKVLVTYHSSLIVSTFGD